MINLQLKIGSSVPSISLNYGRNLAKRPNGGSGAGGQQAATKMDRNERRIVPN